MILKALFWIFFFFLLYTYLGYPVLLWLLVRVKRIIKPSPPVPQTEYEPEVCLFVTAYNESDFVRQKVENSLQLDYPTQKLQYLWITDGSDDGTETRLRDYPHNDVYHQPERRGKMHAMNRGMKFVKAPIIIFSDTNTLLNRNAVREITACFKDTAVGCVAGEKRIIENNADVASVAGEGLYWKYESWVKRMDSEWNTAVGAVGELFAIRKELFEEVEPDTILDDFIISMRIARKGFKIAYTPDAYAEETASLNVKEELKRKVRIAAGGIQSLIRLKELLNPFRFGSLSWQFLSHKVMRWTLAPLSLYLLLIVNGLLFYVEYMGGIFSFYSFFFLLQVFFYLLALLGWILENKKLRLKLLFAPYYFISIHYAAIAGIVRHFRGKQTVQWEKAKRAEL